MAPLGDEQQRQQRAGKTTTATRNSRVTDKVSAKATSKAIVYPRATGREQRMGREEPANNDRLSATENETDEKRVECANHDDDDDDRQVELNRNLKKQASWKVVINSAEPPTVNNGNSSSSSKRRRRRIDRRSLSIQNANVDSGESRTNQDLNVVSAVDRDVVEFRRRCHSVTVRANNYRALNDGQRKMKKCDTNLRDTRLVDAARISSSPSENDDSEQNKCRIAAAAAAAAATERKSAQVVGNVKDKKQIAATFFDDGKDNSLTWLTNLVEDEPEQSDSCNIQKNSSSDDCVFVEDEEPPAKWRVQEVARLAPIGGFIVDCSTASVVANFSPAPLSMESDRRDNSSLIKCSDDDVDPKRSLYRSLYLGHFFRYPRAQHMTNGSTSSTATSDGAGGRKQWSSSCSGKLIDLNESFKRSGKGKKCSPAAITTSQRDAQIELRSSVENLRLMMEKNLIATLIGVYILVSLTIIVVLIMPYIFSGSAPTRGPSTSEAPSTTQVSATIDDDQVSPPPVAADNQTYEIRRVDKGTQTASLEQQQPGSNIISTTTTTTTIGTMMNLTEADVTTKAPSMSRGNQASDNGGGGGQETTSSVAGGATTNKDSRISSLWTVSYTNQKCQPMKIPFCSRSLAQTLGDMDIPIGRLDAQALKSHIIYDKTLLPNQFTQARQSQVERTLQKFEPIIDIKCYALMPLFLCSIHAPKCVQVVSPPPASGGPTTEPGQRHRQSPPPLQQLSGATTASPGGGGGGGGNSHSSDQSAANSNGRRKKLAPALVGDSRSAATTALNNGSIAARLIPPCRSLCKEAFRKCMFFFEVLSLKFLDQHDCDSLPESPDPQVCIGQLENELLQRAVGSLNCGEDKFRCTTHVECISKKWRCDGFYDCTDKSDEANCSKCNALTQFYCGSDVCIKKEQVCNGVRDCRDGRDERQCLRLSPAGVASIATTDFLGLKRQQQQQLQAWSAVKDNWVPVCGAHWSAMHMSHQACQALGFSRANETVIVYGPGTSEEDSAITMHKNVTHPQQVPTNDASTKTLPDRHSIATEWRVEATAPGAEEGFRLSRRSPGGWFDVSSASDGYDQSFREHDYSEQMARIVEDVASASSDPASASASAKSASTTGGGGASSQKPVADHVIRYEMLPPLGGAAVAADLSSIDAAEIKLKSLTAMLYYGPEAGCLGRPGHLASSVYLQCQNFQCGRSISSYSSRIRLQQRPAARQSLGPIGDDSVSLRASHSSRAAPLFRSAIGGGGGGDTSNTTTDDHDPPPAMDGGGGGGQRVRHLEATEELDEDDSVAADEDDDDLKELDDNSSKGQNNSGVSARFVVGGTESMPGEFPYLAALHGGPDEVFFCGGVLISINWLLTAAHCVGNRTQPDGWMVKVGVTRRIASPAFVKKLKVRKIIKHPDFNQESMFNNDIALILLEQSVEYNQYLRPVCLPVANTRLGPDNSKDCVVVGFGKSKYSQEANYLHVAHFVNVPIVHHTVCSNWYAEHGVNLTEGMLCAGYAEGKRDACQGDSGSGLFCRYSNTNQFFVAGVVSFGIKCATPKLPGVYTSVPSYVNWVEQVTRQHGYPLA